MLKTELADVVRERAQARGLRVDITTRPEDTLLGDDWYRWLARCRYTIGVEGGASVLDRDGSVLACTERVAAERPGAGFEELEAACFPGRDGELALRALSPRHLEACATRTAQILVEGDYNGVLEPDRHYIPLRRDFSNLDEVLDLVAADAERERVAAAAYEQVVASGRWTYRRLVEDVEAALPAAARRRAGRLTPRGLARARSGVQAAAAARDPRADAAAAAALRPAAAARVRHGGAAGLSRNDDVTVVIPCFAYGRFLRRRRGRARSPRRAARRA